MARCPSYTETFNLETIVQGDSFLSHTLPARLDVNDQPIVPFSVCVKLVDSFDRPVHSWQALIDPSSGEVTLPEILSTRHIRHGTYNYSARYTLANGQVRVFYRGSFVLRPRISKC